MRERESGNLPPALRDAVRALRDGADAAPTDIWRQRLLHGIADAPAPSRATGARWSARPMAAIAAGLVCALIGASAATVALRRPASLPVPAASVAPNAPAVRFTLVAPGATTVTLVGDFKGWSARGLPLRSVDGRTWEVEVPLAPGRYAYSFVVDGQLARDPSAPQVRDEFLGTTNSVVMVRNGS